MDLKNEISLYSIKALIVLDNDGKRVLAKYYDEEDFPSLAKQHAFEKKLFANARKSDSEIALIDNMTSVYKSNVDLSFFVVGSSSENELLLSQVLSCFYQSVSMSLINVEKRVLLANLGKVYLIVDAIVDQGIVMEVSAHNVVKQTPVRGEEQLQSVDQMFASAIQSATKSFFFN